MIQLAMMGKLPFTALRDGYFRTSYAGGIAQQSVLYVRPFSTAAQKNQLPGPPKRGATVPALPDAAVAPIELP